MKPLLLQVLIAAALTVGVGLAVGSGAGFLIGAIMALALWVGLYAGSFAVPGRGGGDVTTSGYLIGAVVAFAVGCAMSLAFDSVVWWPVGVIIGIVIAPAAGLAARKPDA